MTFASGIGVWLPSKVSGNTLWLMHQHNLGLPGSVVSYGLLAILEISCLRDVEESP